MRRRKSGSKSAFARQLRQEFVREAPALFTHLEEKAGGWMLDPANPVFAREMLCRLHTLKGGARFVGLTRLSEVIHRTETLLTGEEQTVQVLDRDFFRLLKMRLHEAQQLIPPDPQEEAEGAEAGLGNLAQRMQMLVLQLCRELGKEARLEILDLQEKTADFAQLTAVLPHLLRNAVDHGMEPAWERLCLGKERSGKISLGFSGQEDNLVLQLSDDGRGLNSEAIRHKARQLGFMKKPQSLQEDELAGFIFKPGFSTAPQLTEVSGRGIGLYAVAAETARLGGSLTVHSVPGEGTEFRIQVPVCRANQKTG